MVFQTVFQMPKHLWECLSLKGSVEKTFGDREKEEFFVRCTVSLLVLWMPWKNENEM